MNNLDSVTFNAERLRYATKNFNALQGLSLVVLGSAFLFSDVAHVLYAPVHWTDIASILIMLAACPVMVVYIPRYYRRRFGSVLQDGPTIKGIVVLLVAFLVFFILFVMVSELRHEELQSPLLWIFVFGASLRWHPQSIERNRMYFFACCMLASAVLGFYLMWHPIARGSMFWRAVVAASFGGTIAIVGLYEHLTLVRLLPKRLHTEQNEL